MYILESIVWKFSSRSA